MSSGPGMKFLDWTASMNILKVWFCFPTFSFGCVVVLTKKIFPPFLLLTYSTFNLDYHQQFSGHQMTFNLVLLLFNKNADALPVKVK